jgi:hypothetical protein
MNGRLSRPVADTRMVVALLEFAAVPDVSAPLEFESPLPPLLPHALAARTVAMANAPQVRRRTADRM